MNIDTIINKKEINQELTLEELDFSFNGYLKGVVNDSQMTSLLKAICINGMSEEEVFFLTDLFVKSGDILDLSSIPGVKVDKHSTGGVGDKVTLIIGPIVASCNVIVPKMSGRSLGYTGGTIDKLESIAGFKTSLSNEEFIDALKNVGLAIASGTSNLCPLDKVIYALRDVTGTTKSIPLIAVSVMSKKIAAGADKILIDVKCGKGALIDNKEDALKLAHLLEKIGSFYGKETIAEISDMNIPLGNNIGNSLEVIEAIEILKGKKGHLYELCLNIASEMIRISKNITKELALEEAKDALESGKAYRKFLEFIKYQGGDIDSLKVSPYYFEFLAEKSGTVTSINAYAFGKLVTEIGGGRLEKDDIIKHDHGIVLNKEIGDVVNKDDLLFTVYASYNFDETLNPDDFYEIN